MHPRDEDNIVCTWLRFLHVEEYSSNFLDNGYDDLETVKLMREEDLRAIGISSAEDEEIILLSVKILREQGAAWVYFLSGDRDLSVSSSSVKMSDDLSMTSVSSRSDPDPLRRRLEDIEPFSMCDNIYCDIAEIPESKEAEKLNVEEEANSWAEFWRKIFYTKKKRKNVIKRGDFLKCNFYKAFIFALNNFSDATFERLKSILAPDGKTVMSKISNEREAAGHNGSILSTLVRPLQYRTMKLSTPLISRRPGWSGTGIEIEL